MFLDEHIRRNMRISTSQCMLHLELTLLLAILWTVSANNIIPYFTQEPTSAVIPPGRSLTLSCRVHPPESVVRWLFNGDFVENKNSYGLRVEGTDLVIPSMAADNSDNGVYQCSAQNSHGTILSRRAKVSKAVIRRFEDRGSLHLNVTEGSNIVLPCQPPYSRPKAKIMFRINGTSIIDQNTDHYQILPSGNLQIINISTKDQGSYQCLAYNALRNRTRAASHVIQLQVLNTFVPSQEPAVIMPTAKVHSLVGQDVILECSAVGNPQPVITWEKYGGKMNYRKATTKHGNLHLRNITMEDEGTYLCKADNGLNSLMPDGLKAMILRISEPPQVHSVRKSVNVSVGSYLELECIAMGKPKPEISWYHNGQFLKHSDGESKMIVRSAKLQHRGLYQCFAENIAGVQYAVMQVDVNTNKLDSGSLTLSDQNVTTSPSGEGKKPPVGTPAGQDGTRRRRKKKKKIPKKKNSRNGNTRHNGNPEKIQLIPPNKPEVKQLSDTSVMLNWTVPKDTGLKIIFFRVQYKKVGPTKEDWYTDDIEIHSHIRMYEVRGLKSRATYKFRVAAVYSNNDNKHGPNSDRFEMKADPQPVAKPPSTAPTIVEVTAIDFQNIHGLNVRWQYLSTSSSPIEGFFIFYKPYHAETEPYQNVTLLEPSVRAHLLTKLLPSTEYSIHMQSFNSAGKSVKSNQVVERTKGPDNPYPIMPNMSAMPTDKRDDVEKQGSKHGIVKVHTPTLEVSTKKHSEEVEEKVKSNIQSNSEKLYMILGIVLGVMMLLLIVFIVMCWWKQRQQRMMMDAMNDAVRNKFQDSSQRIYTDSMRKKLMNGNLGMNGINGMVANGHIPRSYHKMNINVNPLSEMDSVHSTDGSNHLTPTTFHPNGSIPGHYRASDNNCNNINKSKTTHHVSPDSNVDSFGEEGSIVSHPSQLNNVPIRNYCDSQERRSRRSYDHEGSHGVSCDPCDSSLSYDDTGGVGVAGGRHRKRRRRLPDKDKEQTTKDQATNTDLSSNEGTMDLSVLNKASSSSQESKTSIDDNSRTLNEYSQPPVTEYPSSTEAV